MTAKHPDVWDWPEIVVSVLCVLAFLAAIAFGLWVVRIAAETQEQDNIEREKRILDRGCIHTGFYGRGERKVYSCHGWVVKEEDI